MQRSPALQRGVPSPNGHVSNAALPKVRLPENVHKLVQRRFMKGPRAVR